MEFWDILLQSLLFISGLITLFGSYHESKNSRKKLFQLRPRQIIVLGGLLTIALSIINSIKTARDSKSLEDTVRGNATLTLRIDTVTRRNMEITEIAGKLAQLNYSLSSQNRKLSEINLLKVDTLLDRVDSTMNKAQDIFNNSTGGKSFCIIDMIPVAGTDTVARYIVNVGDHPIRNLTVFAQQKEDNWNQYNTNTTLDYIKTISVLYPSEPFKKSDMSEKTMIVTLSENTAGFNMALTKISKSKKNIRDYMFMAENGFWKEHIELYYNEKKWHKSILVTKDNKKIYNKSYVF